LRGFGQFTVVAGVVARSEGASKAVRCATKEKNGWWGATPPMMCVVCNPVAFDEMIQYFIRVPSSLVKDEDLYTCEQSFNQ
jgi:hypothetical protein